MVGFVDLVVWREAARLAARVTDAAEGFQGAGAVAAADQIVRAAESIAANIAEGYGRGVNRDCLRFLAMARGSTNELEGRLRMAKSARRLPSDQLDSLIEHAIRVRFLIGRFADSVVRRMKKSA